jgi:hypothetical protein
MWDGEFRREKFAKNENIIGIIIIMIIANVINFP